MSSLLRAEAVAVIEGGNGPRVVPARPPGSRRVIRGDDVGLNPPLPLAVPAAPRPVAPDPQVELDLALLAAPAADLAQLEEAARINGYNTGYEEGFAAGQAAAEAATRDSIERLARLASGVLEHHAAFYRGAERQVVDLALQIAQKVVEHEVENIPELAVGVIRAALEEMDARTAVRVRVNPADEELLRRLWTQVVPPGIGPDHIELQADERVQSGGAVIETTQGQVDTQLETKLAQLGNALWTFVTDSSSSLADQRDG
jgi:flagellar assembly protein FliH